MIKIIFTGVIFTAVLWAAVTGINNLLSVDDLKDCTGPSLTNTACAPADAIVAISGGDTPARVAEAVKLYKAGWSSKMIFSGAALDAEGPSNAEAMQAQAISAGVPASAILLENNAYDTTENALHTSILLSDAKRVIVVTSPYHQRRAGLEFTRFLGEQVQVVNHPTPYDRLWPDYWWTTWGGWLLALVESAKTLIVMIKIP
jgi:uncharacterized SAM-binding protein YcdF (DUF218 family)